MDGIAGDAIPQLVGELVARGGSIHAVVPTRHTLEERFLSLLGATPDTGGGVLDTEGAVGSEGAPASDESIPAKAKP